MSATKTTQRERILLHPQDYIGSVDKCTRKMWVFEGRCSMRQRLVTYVPGLYKIFDEVLVYAADNKQRDPSMDNLNVVVDVAECRISVYYTGQGGVPIEEEDGVHVPEMIFGDLSNCQEIAGAGRNSYGVKLSNLFSTEFIVEIVDSRVEKKYKQVFCENMGNKSEPEITRSLLGVNWTRITFKPDLAKFHMTHLDDDVVALMRKRLVDMADFVGITVQVSFNDDLMFQGVESYSDSVYPYLCTASKGREALPRVCQPINNHLEVAVTESDGSFQQVSFANKFATTEGGTHVDYVADQIVAGVVRICRKHFQIEECEVKRHLWVFVNVVIDNPSFDSPVRGANHSPG